MIPGPARAGAVDTADGVRLHWEEVGDPAADAVLLQHGVGSSTTFLLDAFAAPLVEAGWRLVAADLRGHGRSTPVPDPADHAHARHVADVAALAEEVEPAVLGGVSLGGHAAVGAAVVGQPCRAVLACLPAWSGRAVPGAGFHAAVAAEVATRGVGGIVERFRADTTMVPWLRDVLVRDWPVHDPASLAAALTALDGGRAPTSAELRGLAVPLAVVGWPDDPGHPVAEARAWAATAPRAHLEATSLAAVETARRCLGDAAVRSLAALGISAP